MTTNLPSKLESFIKMMLQGDEFAQHGFELLSKRPKPELYFDAVRGAGLFSPDKNSGPVPSNEPGFVQIPFWSALIYLKAVAKRAGELDDLELSEKVLCIVRSVTTFKDPQGDRRDNYHTSHHFAEILGLLPLRAISIEDVKLIGVWIESKFERGLVGSSIAKGLLKRLLASDEPSDTALAIQVMKECMAYEWLPEKNQRGKELVTKIENYWLKALLDAHAKPFGARTGFPGVRIFEDGLRAIFSDARRSFGSTLWRPAIEPSARNLDFRDAENRFVDGMRDALAGWIEAKPDDAKEFVSRKLRDSSEIVRRIAIHTVTENFDLLRVSFEGMVDKTFFTSGLRHEVYRLLAKRFVALSKQGKAEVIKALRELPRPKTGEDAARRLKVVQREWLSAINDQPEAASWYQELSSDPELGPPSDHPDFLNYFEVRSGPGPAPYGRDSLIGFAEDGSLIDRLNEFRETDSWRGPTLGGLVEGLEAAVSESPDTFLPLVSDFHRAKLPFQHAFIAGFKRLYDPSNSEKPKFNWTTAWPKLLIFFKDWLSDPGLWSSTDLNEKSMSSIPTRSWMMGLIADFLEEGTKDDTTAYDPDLLPQGWDLIKCLLDRVESEPPDLRNPMTHALNTAKGRVIGALYNHALRVCRVSQAHGDDKTISHIGAWGTLKPVFDQELAKCTNANFEFSTLSASYIANLDYMSRTWLSDNIRRLFPIEHHANFASAIGGLAYATPNSAIFRMLASNGILKAAMNAKLEDSYGHGRVVEWVCLAFLWGDETLTSSHMRQIFAGGVSDIQSCVDFFWQVRGEVLQPDQVERVLTFWEAALVWAQTQPNSNDVFLSRLSRLAAYLSTLDARALSLLRPVVAHVHSDYSTDQMIEELARLSDSNSGGTIELLEKMFAERTPVFDIDDKLKGLLRKLYSQGHHSEVLRIIEKLRRTLPEMLDFYKELRDEMAKG